MTLEQFANLMQGLGYRAEKAERVKVKAPAAEPVASGPASDAEVSGDAMPAAVETAPDDAPTAEIPAAEPEAPTSEGEDATKEAAPVEMEVFYTFAWGAKRVERAADGPRKGQKPRGKPKQERAPKGKGGKARRHFGQGGALSSSPPQTRQAD